VNAHIDWQLAARQGHYALPAERLDDGQIGCWVTVTPPALPAEPGGDPFGTTVPDVSGTLMRVDHLPGRIRLEIVQHTPDVELTYPLQVQRPVRVYPYECARCGHPIVRTGIRNTLTHTEAAWIHAAGPGHVPGNPAGSRACIPGLDLPVATKGARHGC